MKISKATMARMMKIVYSMRPRYPGAEADKPDQNRATYSRCPHSPPHFAATVRFTVSVNFAHDPAKTTFDQLGRRVFAHPLEHDPSNTTRRKD